MNNFSEIIDNFKPKIELLPLFHSCDTYSLRNILQEKKLVPRECDVFIKEQLLYCFYGKSSYRGGLDKATNNLAFFPTCFILKTKKLPKPKKVFPFDSGAFIKLSEIKEDYFHINMEVGDFYLGNDINCARALVERFYTTNNNYFNAQPTLQEKDIPAINLEARSYLQLIKEKRQSNFDDRMSSIEIVFDKEIDITGETLETIILPGTFYDNPNIKKTFDIDFGINPITYKTHRGNPKEYHALILSEIEKLLNKKSLL